MTGWFVININNHYFEKKLEEEYFERVKKDFQEYGINLEKYNNVDAQFLLLNGKKDSHIGVVCTGKRKTCLGYVWKYEEVT